MRTASTRADMVALVMAMALLFSGCTGPGDVGVSVISDPSPGPGASHGLAKIMAALRAKGVSVERTDSPQAAKGKVLIVTALTGSPGPAGELLRAAKVKAPTGAEALVISHTRVGAKTALLVAGSDDRGLMYAELDIADRIGWATDAAQPLSEVRDAAERPYVPERALSIYTMHQGCFEQRFHDEKYWARYLDMLAANRFNTFVLILGYAPSNFLAPPYPYFFDLPQFPNVRMPGMTPQKQQRNLDSLNRLIAMTHARGLDFTLGIWDHIPRKGFPGAPTGLGRDKLVPYTQAALTKFLKLVPHLDAIQFRMHGESGLRRDEMLTFWPSIYAIMLKHAPNVRLDARAKNFPDALIDKAVEMKVNFRMTTKYWMEQMGMPFHPSHVHPGNQRDRRHGYADLLRYPRKYKMHWKLWNGGTTRILLWGDPEYVRRFARSTHLYDGDGFEVNEPLATKLAMFPKEQPYDLLNKAHRYTEWEFERYWHFYQTWGRLAYNPQTPPEVWRRQFEQRFSKAAPAVERGLHRASWVLPYIVAYCYPYNLFPTLTGWPEKRIQGDLPTYAAALPSDTQQFLGPTEAAKCIMEGKGSAKIWPEASARWFAATAEAVLADVAEAEKRIGNKVSKEFASTMVDLKILAHLANYHSWRARAGQSYALFKLSKDLSALDDAIAYEAKAVKAWGRIAAAAGDVYHDNLMMGRGLKGHWRDDLVRLKEGLRKLRDRRGKFKPAVPQKGPAIAHVPLRKALPNKELAIRATATAKDGPVALRVAFAGTDDKFSYVAMKPVKMVHQGTIPAAQVRAGLRYFIEAADSSSRRVMFPSAGQDAPIDVIVTSDNQPPAVTHQKITAAPAEKPLTVTATVRDPSGVKWVRLRYRIVNQTVDYKTLDMKPTGLAGQYRVTVPAQDLPRKWDFMYLIETMDNMGNGAIYPDLKKETPYVVVNLHRKAAS